MGGNSRDREVPVGSVGEYLKRAAEFEALAAETSIEPLKKRYTDLAACYRLLAKDRQGLISTGNIEGEPPAASVV
jgi:hypothetical protein